MKDVNYLRYYYTSDDMMKDKDSQKHEVYKTYESRMAALFAIPTGLQLWQITLAQRADKLALYKQVRFFKTLAFGSALAIGMWQYTTTRQLLTYYDRFYPEPTELQRKLEQEALMFKEQAYQ